MRGKLLTTLLLSSCASLPLFAQDQQSQSLADIARQSRKAKEDRAKAGTAPAKSFNEENVQSSGAGNLDLTQVVAPTDSSATANAKVSEKVAEARKKFAEAGRLLDELEPMGRPALAARALQDLNGVEFPGRAAWEDRLFAAKQSYVVRVRSMLHDANSLVDDMESMRSAGPLNRNDPRVQSIARRAVAVAEEGKAADTEFNAVMQEGVDLAKRSLSH